MQILANESPYLLELERLKSPKLKWWLSLHDTRTGELQTLTCDTKQIAIEAFKGMTLAEVAAWMDRARVERYKVYKPTRSN